MDHVSFLENFARKFGQRQIKTLVSSLILYQSFDVFYSGFVCFAIPAHPFIIHVDNNAHLRSNLIQDVLIFLLLHHSLLDMSTSVQCFLFENLCNSFRLNILSSCPVTDVRNPSKIFECFSLKLPAKSLENPTFFIVHKAPFWFIVCQ